jgi:pimeloyl-ACP methyl ester carboxylesterase
MWLTAGRSTFMKRGYADTPEGQVHYITEGNGEPVLFLHQTPLSSDEFADVVPIIAKDFHAIAMDTLGYGSSDKPPKIFEISDYVRNIVHFLDTLGIEKISIVGHHTGGILGNSLAVEYPDRINKLVVSAPSLLTAEERQAIMKDPLFTPLQLTDDGAFLQNLWTGLKNAYSTNVSQSFPGAEDKGKEAVETDLIPNELVYRIVLSVLKAGPSPFDAMYAATRYDDQKYFPLIKCPTLLMCGDQDLLFSRMTLAKELLPHSKTRIIEGVGGSVTMVKPAEFAEAVAEFLKSP